MDIRHTSGSRRARLHPGATGPVQEVARVTLPLRQRRRLVWRGYSREIARRGTVERRRADRGPRSARLHRRRGPRASRATSTGSEQAGEIAIGRLADAARPRAGSFLADLLVGIDAEKQRPSRMMADLDGPPASCTDAAPALSQRDSVNWGEADRCYLVRKQTVPAVASRHRRSAVESPRPVPGRSFRSIPARGCDLTQPHTTVRGAGALFGGGNAVAISQC